MNEVHGFIGVWSVIRDSHGLRGHLFGICSFLSPLSPVFLLEKVLRGESLCDRLGECTNLTDLVSKDKIPLSMIRWMKR